MQRLLCMHGSAERARVRRAVERAAPESRGEVVVSECAILSGGRHETGETHSRMAARARASRREQQSRLPTGERAVLRLRHRHEIAAAANSSRLSWIPRRRAHERRMQKNLSLHARRTADLLDRNATTNRSFSRHFHSSQQPVAVDNSPPGSPFLRHANHSQPTHEVRRKRQVHSSHSPGPSRVPYYSRRTFARANYAHGLSRMNHPLRDRNVTDTHDGISNLKENKTSLQMAPRALGASSSEQRSLRAGPRDPFRLARFNTNRSAAKVWQIRM